MMTQLYKCADCGYYTLDDSKCPKCGKRVKTPHPARYSPQDKYGDYRRRAKKRTRQTSS
ncbi:MAG: RNA-protein complex protein Nop10 [Candidatus Thorarchaeota archaeon]|nr:RNA-protein complex protein Nop10 [Candidatus Thorarchaeota archaeon]MCK4740162.1 RNA-protein complex protein Nop10 [Candidatus Thorarchaeota archaeon]